MSVLKCNPLSDVSHCRTSFCIFVGLFYHFESVLKLLKSASLTKGCLYDAVSEAQVCLGDIKVIEYLYIKLTQLFMAAADGLNPMNYVTTYCF